MNSPFPTLCRPVPLQGAIKERSTVPHLAATEGDAVDAPQTVIALHCSGADGNQWRPLNAVLKSKFTIFAPEHFGCERIGHWPGERPFTIDDEAGRTLTLIDAAEGRVHLVGHSYGGGVALYAALQRPGRIASLSLYEPCAFHLLRYMGPQGQAAFAEIEHVARKAADCIIAGDNRGAVAQFIGYWNGPHAWSTLSPRVQEALIRWAPKIPLDFRALMDVTFSLQQYATLTCPTLIMRGTHAPAPTRLLAETLAQTLLQARLQIVPGCGHMGPLTHADLVFPSIASHIETAASVVMKTSRAARACCSTSGDRASAQTCGAEINV